MLISYNTCEYLLPLHQIDYLISIPCELITYKVVKVLFELFIRSLKYRTTEST